MILLCRTFPAKISLPRAGAERWLRAKQRTPEDS